MRQGKDGIWRPSDDTGLCLVDDWVNDVEVALQHVRRFDVALQAGGAYGIWPAYLAKRFRKVYTFEPEEENFDCLIRNIPQNVRAIRGALGATPAQAGLALGERNNAGTWYLSAGSGVTVFTIDSLVMDVDLICLDVEGLEYAALEGAAKTIERCKPVVMFECKWLPHMTDDAGDVISYLEGFGYRVVGRVHRDVVMA